VYDVRRGTTALLSPIERSSGLGVFLSNGVLARAAETKL
jgi:hypothetical protein